MLELLARHANRAGLNPEPGFKPKDVRWAIACSRDGKFVEVLPLGNVSLGKKNRGQLFARCPDLTQPEMVAGGVKKSHFLVDTAEVVALHGDEPKDKDARAGKHAYFIMLLRKASAQMPELEAAARLLESEPELRALQKRLTEMEVKPADKVTFRVGDAYPVESDRWHEWWRNFRRTLHTEDTSAPGEGELMRCFVTGDNVKPLATHPKITGLAAVGGMPAGDVVVGFDKKAFCSYGLEQSVNAAVAEQAAAAYAAGLNDLVRHTGRKLAGSLVVHWFRDTVKPEDDPLAWFEEPPEDQERTAQHRAQELLRSIETGRRPDLGGNRYYALTLSGASGRVMVRDWMEGQFDQLVRNAASWFDDLAIVHREGGRCAPDPKFMDVLGATVRDLKDLPAPFVARMWRVAVQNEPIPHAVVAQALARFRADIIDKDKTLNHARMGLMKAYHRRKARAENRREDMMPTYNEQHPSPAYHCGGLMAVLARLQNAALGDVGAGIVQRYYAAASATPALVLGRLIRGGQFHLNKLDPGLAWWFEQRLGDISGRIGDAMPATLTLEEQSLFALGYYQQLADLRTRKAGTAETEAKS